WDKVEELPARDALRGNALDANRHKLIRIAFSLEHIGNRVHHVLLGGARGYRKEGDLVLERSTVSDLPYPRPSRHWLFEASKIHFEQFNFDVGRRVTCWSGVDGVTDSPHSHVAAADWIDEHPPARCHVNDAERPLTRNWPVRVTKHRQLRHVEPG